VDLVGIRGTSDVEKKRSANVDDGFPVDRFILLPVADELVEVVPGNEVGG
jgi:hypothetical protein